MLTNGPVITQLCPDYMGIELGIGESLIVKAIAQCTGRSNQQIKHDLIKVGDLGLVAEVSPLFLVVSLGLLTFSRFTSHSNREENRRRCSRLLH